MAEPRVSAERGLDHVFSISDRSSVHSYTPGGPGEDIMF